MKADLFNLENKVVGELNVPETVFGVRWNESLVHQALVAQQSNRRRPWAHAKDRSEVRGGGRKPWRQKGTGRARHGSTRSPLWIGGGKAHGPRNERDYSVKLNKKMRRQAIFAILSRKFKENQVRFFDALEVEEPKTKILAKNLREILAMGKLTRKYDVVLVPDLESKNINRAAKNLTKTKVINPTSLNVEDLLNHKNILIDQRAVEVISKHYH
jgi:large subunit ribosomal protein L4